MSRSISIFSWMWIAWKYQEVAMYRIQPWAFVNVSGVKANNFAGPGSRVLCLCLYLVQYYALKHTPSISLQRSHVLVCPALQDSKVRTVESFTSSLTSEFNKGRFQHFNFKTTYDAENKGHKLTYQGLSLWRHSGKHQTHRQIMHDWLYQGHRHTYSIGRLQTYIAPIIGNHIPILLDKD